MLGQCDLCGKNRIIIGTSFTDCFCKECLQLVISECKEGINQIEEEQEKIKEKFQEYFE